jgi:transposase InsO family protein
VPYCAPRQDHVDTNAVVHQVVPDRHALTCLKAAGVAIHASRLEFVRQECLNEHWFISMRHARQVIEDWRQEYNGERPHSSLGYLTPNRFAESFLTADSMSISD